MFDNILCADEKAQISLLEPIDEVVIMVPEAAVGAVMSDLSGRRGIIGRISTDGRYLYFTWEENLGDVWVADVVHAAPQSR